MSALELVRAKILTTKAASELVKDWQSAGQKVVFTNGCFDILHFGHFDYLAKARDLGDRLVIGLNGDASISRLKGKHRPIQDRSTREMAIASLQFVDAVVIFNTDTPLALIERLQPDVLVKGGDYEIDNIVGANFVIKHGGQVKTIDFVPGYSTSLIEEKIRNNTR